MEARGIGPRSEHESDTAPTCVDKAFWVSLPRRLVSPGSNKPLKTLAYPVEAPGYASPTLRYVSAASGGLPLTQVREAEAYAARASSELACVSSQLFYQVTEILGTQQYLHQTRRSLSPPRREASDPGPPFQLGYGMPAWHDTARRPRPWEGSTGPRSAQGSPRRHTTSSTDIACRSSARRCPRPNRECAPPPPTLRAAARAAATPRTLLRQSAPPSRRRAPRPRAPARYASMPSPPRRGRACRSAA